MALLTQEAIFLGNLASADTSDDGAGLLENEAVFNGTFGSSSTPLSSQEVDITYDNADNDDDIQLATNGTNEPAEDISYTLNGVPITTQIDALVLADVSVTYANGSTANYSNVVLIQDLQGNAWLLNSSFGGNDISGTPPGPVESITVSNASGTGPSGNGYTGLFHKLLQPFVCFVAGTLIATIDGLRPVETLDIGDRILTMDQGFQPIRWIGSSQVSQTALQANPKLLPIRIRKAALGQNMPEQDLLVSQQHRILVRSKIARRMFDTAEVLIPANKLVVLDGIEVEQRTGPVEYWHFLFDRHQIVWSNGAATESLFTGPEALKSISPEALEEITTLFPQITSPGYIARPARPIPQKGKVMKHLVWRHDRNQKAMFDNDLDTSD